MILNLIILLAIFVPGLVFYNLTQYNQDDYILISERFEIVDFNDKYLTLSVKNFRYNRTSYAVNISGIWQIDIPGELIFTAQGYKFSSNEYRLFPFLLPFDACDILERNVFGFQNVYDCGNFFRCPIKKGPFNTCNWQPDNSKFPPHTPTGRYMFAISLKVTGVVVANYKVVCRD